jgi:predicted DNA-binding transcriptional regulator AlpA
VTTDRLLTARDVAARLSVSVETVLRWHRRGVLPGGVRLSSNVLRFDERELEQWLATRKDDQGEAPPSAPTLAGVESMGLEPLPYAANPSRSSRRETAKRSKESSDE